MSHTTKKIGKTSKGLISISLDKFIPEHHATFFTEDAVQDLDNFDKWVDQSERKSTDVNALRTKMRAMRGKK